MSEKGTGIEKNYAYDKRGNVCRITENERIVSQCAYGATGQLEEMMNTGGDILKYVYNGAGQRVGEEFCKAADGSASGLKYSEKTDYYLDMTRQYHNLLQKNGAEKTQTFFWDDGIVAMSEDKEKFCCYFKDEHGSPVRLLDIEGQVLQNYSYDEFGRNRNPRQECPIQPFGFLCYTHDQISDGYFAHVRGYRPDIGRFLARDLLPGSKRSPVTMNAYTYCYNNPVRLADRNGMWPSLSDIKDTLSDWGESLGNTLDDWGDAVHEFIEDPHKVIAQTIDNVSEAISDGVEWICSGITEFGKNSVIMNMIRGGLEGPVEGLLHSPVMLPVTIATQQGWLDELLADADFHRDKAGIFHTSPDCWQQYLGYCDLYDWAFDIGTKMRNKKYKVTLDNEEFCIWMWKGDYLNLGAGAETGIYKGGEPFWEASVEDALPMTLALYDKDGNVIMCYNPSDPQWWITGFEPMVQNALPQDLIVIGSIDFSTNPDLWRAYKRKYGSASNIFCFDEENQILYYQY